MTKTVRQIGMHTTDCTCQRSIGAEWVRRVNIGPTTVVGISEPAALLHVTARTKGIGSTEIQYSGARL